QVSRKTFLAISAEVMQGHCRATCHQLRFPNDFVKALESAMEAVWAVIGRQGINFPIESEFSFGNAISHAAYDRSEEGALSQVAGQIVVAEHHIAQLSIFVRHLQRDYDATVIANLRLGSFAVGQGEKLDGSAIGHLAEALPGNYSDGGLSARG